jgi:hypothetical protein
MGIGKSLLILALVLPTFQSHAFAEVPMACEMISASEKRSFELDGTYQGQVSETLKLSLIQNQKSVSLEFSDSSPSWQGYSEVYLATCDLSLNCSGSTRLLKGSEVKKQRTITWLPLTYGLGKIGDRDVFQFHRLLKGFSFRFFQTDNPDEKIQGVLIECHEAAK